MKISAMQDTHDKVDESSIASLHDDDDMSKESEGVIAQRETKAVLHQRQLVFFVLFAAACIVTGTSYRVIRRSELKAFENAFELISQRLLNEFQGIATQKVKIISSFSTLITSDTMAAKTSWPFVTIPDFHQRAKEIMDISETLELRIQPVVTDETREEWKSFAIKNSAWLEEGRQEQRRQHGPELMSFLDKQLTRRDLAVIEALADKDFVPEKLSYTDSGISEDIFALFVPNEGIPYFIVDPGPGPYLPTWYDAPVVANGNADMNLNVYNLFEFGMGTRACLETEEIVIGPVDIGPPGDVFHPHIKTAHFARLLTLSQGKVTNYTGEPMSLVHVPVFDSFNQTRATVAVLTSMVQWKAYFLDLLVGQTGGITIVLENTCGGLATYQVDGPNAEFVGYGDLHDRKFSRNMRSYSFGNLFYDDQEKIKINQDWCPYGIRIYPTQEFADNNISRRPLIFSLLVAGIFLFAAAMFVFYDHLVERRQKLVLSTATKSTAIVSSMFPKSIQDRLMERDTFQSDKERVKSFLIGGPRLMDEDEIDDKPIADLFPNATVLFADMTGFTSWSSSREPGSVFILLQTVYQAFDIIARRRRVFKVETVGDCYVACTGIPNPQSNHAMIMVKFAKDCLLKLATLTKRLEVVLGPDTSDIGMRIGIHSGPITAGVLRGERARFQLFGDTVNVASRMESTGHRNMIQVSQATAELLRQEGVGHWLSPRQENVEAKGKGVLETYWVTVRSKYRKAESFGSSGDSDMSSHSGSTSSVPTGNDLSEKEARLVDWMSQLFLTHLKKVIALREVRGGSGSFDPSSLKCNEQTGLTWLEEVEECIKLPKYCASLASLTESKISETEVAGKVRRQVKCFISRIAHLYHPNAFHSFEHAAHVTMCVDKFLKRIVRPDIEIENDGAVASHLHDYTHGLNSDPTAILAIIVSAMIHDCDHRGVSNIQLAKEDEQMAELYKNKSIAEQNSLELAWNLLMEDQFVDLRAAMFADEEEMDRFRQVLINVVLATDIFDKELNGLRKLRWENAFAEGKEATNQVDYRATIVIEHIIQASDVCHTMQHWHVYRKWNKRLFLEMHSAFKAGRMGKDPSTFWYQGELGFFDNYIIPLARKLKECNVFGVSSDECLNYATRNRSEWEQRGVAIVEEMMADINTNTDGVLSV